ncbi:hypothetical protein HCH_00317 [Hahella chejuensis KCTC 2396]|uniref:Uncharacterized protein n=2 Tax=Hahella chejuensis TaxID=158327 RepID=Q2SQ45_HAHCH|nr:hypothetical protein HCH_00317 [Hahella chejuensis KCTC 2396]
MTGCLPRPYSSCHGKVLPLMLGLALLAGCAGQTTPPVIPEPQAETPTFEDMQPTPEAEAPEPKPPTRKTKPKQKETCVFRPLKGVAEVLETYPRQWLMNFYPGDLEFIYPTPPGTPSPQPGEEFRAIRYKKYSGPCPEEFYELMGPLH